jgi:hypothetical protein
MPEPRGRLYELALRALDEQEHHVGELRGRLAPVIAAGGIGLTLLTRPAFAGQHPHGAVEIIAVLVGMIGAVALIMGSAYVLIPRPVAFSVNAHATLETINQADADMLDDEDLFHETMILTLAERHDGNAPILERLNTATRSR